MRLHEYANTTWVKMSGLQRTITLLVSIALLILPVQLHSIYFGTGSLSPELEGIVVEKHLISSDIKATIYNTVESTIKIDGLTVKAEVQHFWIDTHSPRRDAIDERVVAQLLLFTAMHQYRSESKLSSQEMFAQASETLIGITEQYITASRGSDWLSITIKSITFNGTDGVKQTQNIKTTLINPYYRNNRYMRSFFPEAQKK